MSRKKKAAGAEPGAKSEETRRRILEAALACFRKQGFEKATMREIAAEAGVAVGAAYYYFDSKDAIVMAFYERASGEMGARIEKVLAGRTSFETRLRAVIEAKFEVFAPDRGLLRALAVHTDPAHPLSPFARETEAIRERDIEFFRAVIEGSRLRVPTDIKPQMPGLLWMYQMGLLLYWVYDRSPEQRRAQRLFERSLSMVVKMVELSGLPFLRPVRRLVRELVEIVAGEEPEEMLAQESRLKD